MIHSLMIISPRIQVSVGYPVGHRAGVPSHVLRQGCPISIPASRSGPLGMFLVPSVGTGWDGSTSHSMRKSELPHLTEFKILIKSHGNK